MKKPVCLLAALACFATLVSAKEKAKAESGISPPSPFSLGVFLSYWNVDDLDEFDLNGAVGAGIEGQIRLHSFLAVDLRLSGYGADRYEEAYCPCGCWTDHETTLFVMPLEAGLLAILPVGDMFSLYGGPGVGYYFFDGEYRIDYGRRETLYDIDMDDESGFYALLGVRAQFVRNAAFFFEGKYVWIDSSLETRDESLDRLGRSDLPSKIDFDGFLFNAGLLFTF